MSSVAAYRLLRVADQPGHPLDQVSEDLALR